MTDPLEGDRAGALASAPAQLPVFLTRQREAREAALLDALRALAAQLGRNWLCETDVASDPGARAARLTIAALRWRFGSFSRALQAAGLHSRAIPAQHSDEACFANLARVWRHHGRPPKVSDMNRAPSTIGESTATSASGRMGGLSRITRSKRDRS